jgi:Protein of unknown function (DUF3224)
MTRTLETKLHIDNWDEKPYRELPDGRKFTRAEVQLTGTAAEGFGSAAFEALMYYRADGTGTYVTLMSLEATLDGRSGGIVLSGEGTYDGTSAEIRYRVVEAGGELAGLTGQGTSRSTHEDYPNMPLTLEYDLA